MSSFLDLNQRWRLLVPPDTVVIATGGGVVRADITDLPEGTRVALVGGRRLRRLARRCRIAVEVEYVALPSLATPVAITQVATEPLRWTMRTVLTVPSGVTRLHAVVWAGTRVLRWRPRLLPRVPAGDRILVGVRT